MNIKEEYRSNLHSRDTYLYYGNHNGSSLTWGRGTRYAGFIVELSIHNVTLSDITEIIDHFDLLKLERFIVTCFSIGHFTVTSNNLHETLIQPLRKRVAEVYALSLFGQWVKHHPSIQEWKKSIDKDLFPTEEIFVREMSNILPKGNKYVFMAMYNGHISPKEYPWGI